MSLTFLLFILCILNVSQAYSLMTEGCHDPGIRSHNLSQDMQRVISPTMPPFLLGVKKDVLTQHPDKVFTYFVSRGAHHMDLCLKVVKYSIIKIFIMIKVL